MHCASNLIGLFAVHLVHMRSKLRSAQLKKKRVGLCMFWQPHFESVLSGNMSDIKICEILCRTIRIMAAWIPFTTFKFGEGTFARMDFCQNSGKCLFWDFCQKLIFIKETIARNEFWQMSQSIYWVLANVPVVISSSGKCPSWYIKFWQMSQLLYWVLANVPVDILSSGKCPSCYIEFWQMS